MPLTSFSLLLLALSSCFVGLFRFLMPWQDSLVRRLADIMNEECVSLTLLTFLLDWHMLGKSRFALRRIDHEQNCCYS